MNGKTILHIANYAAPYMGNFVESLVALERALAESGARMVYVFPDTCRARQWSEEFAKEHIVYFVEAKIDRVKVLYNPKVIEQLIDVFRVEKPDIIHSHFDGYDIPVILASRECGISAQIIWHHHNPRTLVANPIKQLYQKLRFFQQYRIYGKRVHIVAVSESCLDELRGYSFDMRRAVVINNGICESRISMRNLETIRDHEPFTFLCFGGRGNDKGVDLLVEAVKQIEESHSFRVILVRGVDTETFLPVGGHPTAIEATDPIENINLLFERADCFISCSRRETFSYAVHEAMLYGLPVVSSQIPALEKANRMPSVISFQCENADALARAMLEMITSDIHRNSDSLRCAREYVEKEFTIAVWAKRVVDLYCFLMYGEENSGACST